MGDRGSKSENWSVKEQRVDGSLVIYGWLGYYYRLIIYLARRKQSMLITIRCTLVAGKNGFWNKLSNSRLKIPQ